MGASSPCRRAATAPAYVPFCTLAVIEGLVGERSAVVDPYEGSSELVRSKLEYRPVQWAAI